MWILVFAVRLDLVSAGWLTGTTIIRAAMHSIEQRDAVVHDPALLHDDRTGDEWPHLPEFVGDQQQGGTGGNEHLQSLSQDLSALGIQSRSRLVQHEDVGFAGQCACN